MESCTEDQSLFFPLGNLLLLGVGGKQRRGHCLSRGLPSTERETDTTFGGLMDRTEKNL